MSHRILIVDDSHVIRTLHSYILRGAGFETEEADSGFAALEAMSVTRFDLAVVDVNMPRMDGFSLIREMRRDGELKDIPVIVVSTEREARDQKKGRDAGANGYVVKPTNPEDLLARVRTLLNQPEEPR